MMRRRGLLLAPMVLTVAQASRAAFAQGGSAAFPDRPIRLIVPYPPGGSTDPVARLLAGEMQPRLGQPMVVDNRSGAAGSIGTEFVARAPADGHTLLFHTSAIATDPSLKRNLPYDVEKDLAPASLLGTGAYLLVANPKLPVRDLRGLVEFARANPGKLLYGSAGIGSSGHLIGEMFARRVGIQMTHVPYRGGGPSITGLLGNEIQLVFDTVQTSRPLVVDGQLRGLAVTAAERSPLLPEVPTVAETVLPGFTVVYWHGILAPAATPAASVNRLSTAFREVLEQPSVRERLTGMGLTPVGSTPDAFRTQLLADIASWREVIRAADIRLD